jgi:hypothetical protein
MPESEVAGVQEGGAALHSVDNSLPPPTQTRSEKYSPCEQTEGASCDTTILVNRGLHPQFTLQPVDKRQDT